MSPEAQRRVILAEIYRDVTLDTVTRALVCHLEAHLQMDGQELAGSIRSLAEVIEGAINDLNYDFIEKLKREVKEYGNGTS